MGIKNINLNGVESTNNKATDFSVVDDIKYPTVKAVQDKLNALPTSLGLGESSTTAYRGDRGKTAYDHSQVTTGNPHNVTKSNVGLGNVPNTDFTSAVAANTAKVTNATHTGEVTGSGVLTITAKAVTNAKLADVATNTIKGRIAAGSGTPTDLTPAEVRTMLNVDNSDFVKETVVTVGGAINNQATPTNFLNFTNQTTPVILAGFNNVKDGKELTIWNNTLQAIDLLNDSPSATAVNRMINLGLQDLLLPVDGKAVYRYSASLSRWTMVGIFGAGYESTLIGTGTRAVTISPMGVFGEEELEEFKVWNTAITTNQSESDLNTLYPNAFQGFTVVCINNNREYEMDDETQNTWIWRTINRV